MVHLYAFAPIAVPFLLLIIVLRKRPDVPKELNGWPSMGFVYLQLVRSALSKKKLGKKGEPIEIKLTLPVQVNAKKYAKYLKLTGYKDIPTQIPLNYPFVECFPLAMLAMSHPDFPFPVLGAVLARNTTRSTKPINLEDKLIFSVTVDTDYIQNEKGHYEIAVKNTVTTPSGEELWVSDLTVLVINRKAKRGDGGKPSEQALPEKELLEHWKLPANTGRQFGALTGDRNPIHLYPFTSQLFGFKRPICHALYLVGRLEGAMTNAGYKVTFPASYITEFKRPTLLPAKLQAVLQGSEPGTLNVAVLTEKGDKEVIKGQISAAAVK